LYINTGVVNRLLNTPFAIAVPMIAATRTSLFTN
jgi:hypothetical protein